ncbi:MAG: lamin tail domain-containing protein, partial [Sedimentisphaerales bacterium]|nr:lamin tail domain-containing protein [Sedimentisphaerales bacterium]
MFPSRFKRQVTHQRPRFSALYLLASVFILLTSVCKADIVINEIHYDPDVKTEAVEFIELYNTEMTPIDLSGWYFSNGLSYEFPAGSTISPRGYIIVAYSPAQVLTKWGGNRDGVPSNL